MTRRRWFSYLVSSLGFLVAVGVARPAAADEQQANLNETLRSVMRARRPQEFAFVNLVTAKVNSGKLPLPLVLSAMRWAQQRARERNDDIPFPYFQEGLRLRAKEIGVHLPPFKP
jgi:hypothetical protein